MFKKSFFSKIFLVSDALLFMVSGALQFQLDNLPSKPGCYIFHSKPNKKGDILYIGKAKNLKNRVKNYWRERVSEDPLYQAKIHRLASLIKSIDFFIVENESEALILENELISKHRPKFNADLKDDKSFPWVRITNEHFPRISIIRNPEKYSVKDTYMGPFVDAKDLKKMLTFIRKIFPYCTCKKRSTQENKKRPCVNYQIKLCPGPCRKDIRTDKEFKKEYMENIGGIKQMLIGKITPLQKMMKEKMNNAAGIQDYEGAALWRDRLEMLEMFTVKQSILTYDLRKNSDNKEIEWKNVDVAASFQSKKFAGFIVIHVKTGRVIGKTPYVVNIEEKIATHTLENDFFLDLFQQHFLRDDIPLPDEIVIETALPPKTEKIFQDYFKNTTITPIFRLPNEKDKTAGIMRIAKKNIKLLVNQQQEYINYLESHRNEDGIIEIENIELNDINQGLKELRDVLGLNDFPLIIEAFDMSHFQGEDYVGSKVSFLEGKPNLSEYRRYKIKSDIDASDDVGAMREVLTRRYTKLVEEKEEAPDLIIVDGGIPQLNVAHTILTNLGIADIPHVGIAKPEGRSEISKEPTLIFFNAEGVPLRRKLPLQSKGLHIIQHIRNESHRFAIKYHRTLRKRRASKSALDKISGIGPARKEKLLRAFGSVDTIKETKIEDLELIIGKKMADVVWNHFHSEKH